MVLPVIDYVTGKTISSKFFTDMLLIFYYTLRSGLWYRKSSVVCNVRAPYSWGWNFRQYFLPFVP